MSRHQPVSPFERAAFHRRGSAGIDLGGLNLQAIVPQAAAPVVQAQAPQPMLNVNTQVDTFRPGFSARAANLYTLTIYDLPPNMLFTPGGGVIALYDGQVPYPESALHPVGRDARGQFVFMSPARGTVALLTSETQFPNPTSVREDEVRPLM